MPVKTIPLVGSLINRNVNPLSFSTKDQLFTNCYPEVVTNSVTGKSKVYLNKRIGCSASSALSGVLQGWFASSSWSGVGVGTVPIAIVFGNTGVTSISVWLTNGTKIGGDIANTVSCSALTETSISGTANLVGFFTESAGAQPLEAWYYPAGGAWTQITDADFPPNLGTPEPLIGAPVHMNGRMYVMTTNGKIWNSDQNSLSAWTASAFNTAQSYPDGGCGLARAGDILVAFGTQSIEFFHDVGLTPSPIITIGNTVRRFGGVRVGTGTPPTIYSIGDKVYFIGTDTESGRMGVFRITGLSVEKISTPAIDKILNTVGIGFFGFCGACNLHGMSHIIFYTLNDNSTNLAYCIDTNLWWTLTISGSEIIRTVIGSEGTSYFASGSAKIFTISQSSPLYQDAGSSYTMTIQLENMDMGTQNRKFWKRIKPIGDVQSAASTLTVKYSDDDYATYTTAGTIDLNSQAAMEIGLTRLGSSRRRSWKLEHAANTPCRLEAIEIEYDVGSS